MAKKVDKSMLTKAQLRLSKANLDTINMYRSNPCVACRDLLGIQLLDYQAVILQQSWIAENVVWLLTRNGGKTVLAAIYMMLDQLLFPERELWILGTNGKQSKKLYSYVERLGTNTIKSFGDLPDIYFKEIKRTNSVGSGFGHDASGHRVKLMNESYIKTLNDNPDGNRGERGSTFFDEASFIPEKSIVAVEPYSAQDTSFQSSIDPDFDQRALTKKRPLQRIYFSSAGDKTCYFYQKYVEFSKRMIAGDTRYFVADITIDIPLEPTIRGKKCGALLSKSVLSQALATNPTKAMREFYNKWDVDGGDDQIIKSSTMNNNSTFQLPEMIPDFTEGEKVKYGIFYDPAAIADNAVVLIGKFIYNSDIGWYGKVVNMVNFKDLTDTKGNRQKTYPEQIEELRSLIVRYNDSDVEYENIHKVGIDAGTGGGGILYGHTLIMDYQDKYTKMNHRGITDKELFADKQYEYPNAYPILRMIEPTKWKPIMSPRLVELMNLGLIHFPKEYNNSGHLDIEADNDEGFVRRNLSQDEQLALMNIDICKEEAKMIHRFKLGNERYTYKLRSDMQNNMHDDRFYTLLMFADELYTLRDNDAMNKGRSKKTKDRTILSLFN